MLLSWLRALVTLVKQHATVLLSVLAFFIIMFGKADDAFIAKARSLTSDLFTPVVVVFSKPIYAVIHGIGTFRDLTSLRDTNDKLKVQAERAQELEHEIARLLAENQELKQLQHFQAETSARFISARVIADTGDAFVRSLILYAGIKEGIAKNDIVTTGDGLLGRISFVGDRTSRVLLLTDASSRIPVAIEPLLHRAVLAGDNSEKPKLLFAPIDAQLNLGDRVVTASVADGLPAGLPVGVISDIKGSDIRVRLFADRNRVNFVRVYDYGLRGLIPEDRCEVFLKVRDR